MAAPRLNIVLAQGPSKHPQKRGLEEEICAALIMEPDLDVSIVPHLYHLAEEHTGTLFLRSLSGNFLLLSWLYPRAAFWVLSRAGIRGHLGETLLKSDDEEDEDRDGETALDEDASTGIDIGEIPDRKIWCLDLRMFHSPEPYLDEIRRIAAEARIQPVQLTNLSLVGATAKLPDALKQPSNGKPRALADESVDRRWYPVIDYARCTNCMECIDFCLFGVYGTDVSDNILVEQPDECRKGCPACSRVCPENAIIFPEHKAPAIAGAPGEGPGGLKIDLSKLFGAPSALEIAAQERDVELVQDGREAVGLTVGIPKRQTDKLSGPKDELDNLIDSLDELEL